jgi:hypothetical protein
MRENYLKNNHMSSKSCMVYIYIHIYIVKMINYLLIRLSLHFTTLVDTSLSHI